MKKNAPLIRFLALLLLLAAAVTLFFIWQGYIRRSAGELLALSVQAEGLAQLEQWEQLDEVMAVFDEKWNASKGMWQAFIDHFEIDNITFSLSRAVALVRIRCLDNLAPELAALSSMLRHIPLRQSLTAGNLF